MDYRNCTLCPRLCGVDRAAGERGFCGCPPGAVVSKAMLHKWEEPVLAGENGSGAIFFGGCTLRCSYCQNVSISRAPKGETVDGPGLRKIMDDLVARGADNIDLVTPTQYLPMVLDALEEPLSVPVVYNCGGYERVETVEMCHGKVDIWLPDLKYGTAAPAKEYSAAPDYFSVATQAIKAMFRQVGPCEFQGDRLKKGVLIRHLILPGQVESSLRVLDWIAENFRPGQVLVSLMRQYTPMPGMATPLDRTITEDEYDGVLSWMYLNGLQGFTQESGAANREFIPDFQSETGPL